MRYKLTLTTVDGELLEQWNVCMAQAAQINDEYNLSKLMARLCLIGEITERMEAADLQANGRGHEDQSQIPT